MIYGPRVPGIIAALGEMKLGTIVTEERLAQCFNRNVVSVKRAVHRGELPLLCRLFGASVWTAGIFIRHIEQRLAQAAREAAKDTKRIQSYGGR
jgi:hypothetical protein